MRQAKHPLSLALIIAVLISALTGGTATAATMTVRVVGPDGEPVPEVAVYVEQTGVPWTPASEPQLATMAQVNREFSPQILIVEKGTRVAFPNQDTVAHHVYSFSKPNDFVLPLYKGNDADPVSFDFGGVAILGCNIHDLMVGYVVVVEASVYGITDDNGAVQLQVSDTATAFTINGWGARIKRADLPLRRRVDPQSAAEVVFTLSNAPYVQTEEQNGSVKWDDY
ncbi:MAG: methylamine utilization protein [Pseudomonadota bacterium]